jgi:steroid delta-isomerase-like uncharacterized protein
MMDNSAATRAGTATDQNEQSHIDRENQTLAVAREIIEALNAGDRERFSACLTADAVWHSAATGENHTGRDTVTRNLFGYRGTFPDLHEEIANAFASPDQAVIETVVTGTYDGKVIPTIPGSGARVNFPLCYLFRVSNGKIARVTTYVDYRTLLDQLETPAV